MLQTVLQLPDLNQKVIALRTDKNTPGKIEKWLSLGQQLFFLSFFLSVYFFLFLSCFSPLHFGNLFKILSALDSGILEL